MNEADMERFADVLADRLVNRMADKVYERFKANALTDIDARFDRLEQEMDRRFRQQRREMQADVKNALADFSAAA